MSDDRKIIPLPVPPIPSHAIDTIAFLQEAMRKTFGGDPRLDDLWRRHNEGSCDRTCPYEHGKGERE